MCVSPISVWNSFSLTLFIRMATAVNLTCSTRHVSYMSNEFALFPILSL